MNPSSLQPQQSQQQLQQQLQLQLQLQQRLKQQTLSLIQQQHLFQPGLLAAVPQIDPVPSGNLPPGFDASSCRSVYVGNIHPQVSEALLTEVFASAGLVESCKLIKKEKSSYGFVDYYDHRSAVNCILSLNGRLIFGQAIKVNWAYANGQREDTTGHSHIFVGDLSPEVTDATLFAAFSIYRSCSDARVMWDQRSGRSRGFGFVSFRDSKDAETAITEMSGKWLGSRVIRCNWAAKSASGVQGDQMNNSTAAGTNSDAVTAKDQNEMTAEGDKPENNPHYTTVYVGNLAHNVTQNELHRQFHELECGVIEDVKVQQDKGFGFVRYQTHDEAAVAIEMANGMVIGGKSIKCSWGNKPTVPGAVSNPLPPPLPVTPFQGILCAGLNQTFSAADLLAYQRQLSLAQAGAGQALLPLPQQQGLGMGITQGTVGAASNPGILDGLQQGMLMSNPSIGQQLLYYS